jgi:putative colanic acid biosynthesis acetyltransferase WcaF
MDHNVRFSHRRLADFETDYSAMLKLKYALWSSIGKPLLSISLCSSNFRILLLKAGGCKIGKKVVIRNGVKVHFPWKLELGDHCWIGEGVWFINHEEVVVGSNVCISQRSIICSGGHDYLSASLVYAHKPVTIKDGAWVCLDAKVLPGVTIGECSVVSAGEIVRKSLPDYSMLVGWQVLPIDPPK